MLSTPTASDTFGARQETRPGRGEDGTGNDLRTQVAMLPTPAARDGGTRGSQHPDKRAAGGHQVTLNDVTEHALLPTPVARDWKATGPADQQRNTPGLSAAASLLPTPTATDSKGSRGLRRDGSTYGPTSGTTLTDAAETLLPTPKASDGAKGGPNQRGSSGDLTLPSAAVRLIPTPLASDAGPRGGTTGFGLRDWSRNLPADGDRTGPPSDDGRLF
jgi:DNA (cytosine-5)-methyltransferase 1